MFNKQKKRKKLKKYEKRIQELEHLSDEDFLKTINSIYYISGIQVIIGVIVFILCMVVLTSVIG